MTPRPRPRARALDPVLVVLLLLNVFLCGGVILERPREAAPALLPCSAYTLPYHPSVHACVNSDGGVVEIIDYEDD